MSITSIGTPSISQYTTSTTQTERAQSLFKAMDTDSDGQVSKSEFSEFDALMKAAPPPMAPVDAGNACSSTSSSSNATGLPSSESLFAAADANADSSLSVDELSSMLAASEARACGVAGAPPPPPETADVAFTAADADGDGTLSRAEFESSLGRTPTDVATTSGSSSVQDLLTSADTNGDGLMNIDELTAMMAKMQSDMLKTSL
jgi:Ca2+-binding EF-hand superfamily protein